MQFTVSISILKDSLLFTSSHEKSTYRFHFIALEFVCEWKIMMNAIGGRMIEQSLKYPGDPDGCFRHCSQTARFSRPHTNGLRYLLFIIRMKHLLHKN